MKRSAIPWTDYSAGDLNFVTGCTPISEGCINCYARRIYERFGRDFTQVQTHPDKLERLRKWNPPADGNIRGPHSRPLAFVCDTGDLFHRVVRDAFLLDAFDLLVQRSDITWQVLTKRVVRAMDFLRAYVVGMGGQLPGHIWIGVTAENQRRADQRIPYLLRIPAAVRFVSVEPMLEAVDISRWIPIVGTGVSGRKYLFGESRLSWVICGAESGPGRRPFDAAWAEELYGQCRAAGVPFFGKQDSGNRPGRPLLIDGREIHEFPEVH